MNLSFAFFLLGQCFLVFSAMQDGLVRRSFFLEQDAVCSIRTYISQLVLHTICLGSEQWLASRSSLSHRLGIDFDLILYYF